MTMANILIVDDERNYLLVLEDLLTDEGYSVITAERAERGLEVLREHSVDAVVTDMKMPGMDGMTFLEHVHAANPDLPVIMMTAYGTVEKAVEAMKKGAYDYILKPFENEELKLVVRKAVEHHHLIRRNQDLTQALQERYCFDNIIGKSAPMQRIYDLIERVAPTKATVLITGESGTGKELIARAIHYNSPRKNHSFISVNCGALPENLLESELFGHERGAFSGAVALRKGRFELAHQGTLFLDEISEMSPSLQVKLLRALQEMAFERVGGSETLHVDVRVVAASNRNLKAETTAGRFRSDLYYRLNVVHITLPPLRERPEDIPLLADHFLKKYARETGRENFRIHPEALRYLLDYPWPGNVRELENTIERAVILAAEEVITPRDLPQEIRRPRTSTVEAGSTEPVLSPREPGIAPMPEESDLARRLPHSPHRHRQLRALELVRSLGSVTNRDYSQLNDISERQALRELNEMVDLGVLERIGKGRASRYVLQENRRPTP